MKSFQLNKYFVRFHPDEPDRFILARSKVIYRSSETIFSEINLKSSVKCFDFCSPSSILVGLESGEIQILDLENNLRLVQEFQTPGKFEFSCNSVKLNRFNNLLFCSCYSGLPDGFLIWNRRDFQFANDNSSSNFSDVDNDDSYNKRNRNFESSLNFGGGMDGGKGSSMGMGGIMGGENKYTYITTENRKIGYSQPKMKYLNGEDCFCCDWLENSVCLVGVGNTLKAIDLRIPRSSSSNSNRSSKKKKNIGLSDKSSNKKRKGGTKKWFVYDQPVHTTSVKFVKVNPINSNLYATCSDYKIRIWDFRKNKNPINQLTANSGTNQKSMNRILEIHWSPHQKNILGSCDLSAEVRLWNVLGSETKNSLFSNHRIFDYKSVFPFVEANYVNFQGGLRGTGSPLKNRGMGVFNGGGGGGVGHRVQSFSFHPKVFNRILCCSEELIDVVNIPEFRKFSFGPQNEMCFTKNNSSSIELKKDAIPKEFDILKLIRERAKRGYAMDMHRNYQIARAMNRGKEMFLWKWLSRYLDMGCSLLEYGIERIMRLPDEKLPLLFRNFPKVIFPEVSEVAISNPLKFSSSSSLTNQEAKSTQQSSSSSSSSQSSNSGSGSGSGNNNNPLPASKIQEEATGTTSSRVNQPPTRIAINYVKKTESLYGGRIKTYVTTKRKVCLYLSGWFEILGKLEMIRKWDGKGEPPFPELVNPKGIAFALMNNDIQTAEALVKIMASSKSSEFISSSSSPSPSSSPLENVVCFAIKELKKFSKQKGLSGSSFFSSSSSWMEEIHSPYLKCFFLFLQGQEIRSCLRKCPQILFPDKLIFLLKFLNDSDLLNCIHQMYRFVRDRGDCLGLLISGLSSDFGIRVIKNYVDRTMDIQFPCLLFLQNWKPSFNEQKHLYILKLLSEYRKLLNRWKMWEMRAILDSSLSHLEVHSLSYRLYPKKPEIQIECSNCYPNKKISGPNKFMFPQRVQKSISGGGSAGGSSKLLSSSEQKKKIGSITPLSRRHISCDHCEKPLAKCCVCLMPFGLPLDNLTSGSVSTISSTQSTGGTPNSMISTPQSSDPLKLKVDFESGFVWCQRCRHGGHVIHLKEWFENHNVCPCSNCDCTCSLIDFREMDFISDAQRIQKKNIGRGSDSGRVNDGDTIMDSGNNLDLETEISISSSKSKKFVEVEEEEGGQGLPNFFPQFGVNMKRRNLFGYMNNE